MAANSRILDYSATIPLIFGYTLMTIEKHDPVQAHRIKGWEILGTSEGTAALIFGGEIELDTGDVTVAGLTPVVLTVEQCLALSANLVEIADRITGTAGRA
jgi:hypothetical protein